MDIKWLDDFMALAELESFSAAAKARHVTQSAFSRRIQALEVWLGVPLFDRSTHPITLTEHGKNFVQYAEKILETVRITKEDFYNASLKTDTSVRIVCLHSFAINLIPRLFDQAKEYIAGLYFDINPSVQGIDNHYQALLDNSSDILFAYDTRGMRPSLSIEDRFEQLPLLEEKILPVAAPSLLENWPEDKPFPYLAYSEQTFLKSVVTPVIEAPQLALKQVVETTLSETLIKMATAGQGIAWVPYHAIEAELARGDLVPAFPHQPELTIPLKVVCYRSKGIMRPSVRQFWQGLEKIIHKIDQQKP
ncbi:LysR family transcriptional regulator [Vibrio sp. SCSIO 43137]|uniref:LysR family transcriptional regulator n=1 Tax=Vibrio sp. SCSIO 43137 TaxID=3021011 RepID=UPI002306F4DE|nr:LysR family transcriptional regulator [Vibrio sp. SCSIO 43137]WCE30835.1 LysR family transcriptional regulator [Vibrio sp. SCSIO 43137]